MKSLSREAIQRMFNGESVGAGGGGNFDPSMISGLAQQSWVEENFVSIEWFDQIFQVFDDSTKLDVNGELPVDQSKMNIEAMFGFWTDFYMTALGNGGQISASVYLAGLADVNVAGVQTGQVLTWNQAQNKWIATTPSSGVDMTVVWGALAANTNEQINASHLSTALTGYATQNDLKGYLPLTGGTLTGALGVSGRLYGSGDDEGIVITPASNGYAGLILGGTTGRRSVFYLDNSSAFWRYCSGDGSSYYDITHPNASGTIALQSWVSDAYLPLTGGAMVAGARISGSGGELYLGNANNASWLKLADTCSQSGDSYWRIYASGDATFANVLSNGYVTALSDEREKNIIEHFEIPLDFIAKAPIVSYEWKDKERRGDKQHIGSIAQYWLREMPELVPEVNGRYTMDYGRIALLSAILTARHVVNLEQRIAQLEKTLRGE